TTTLDLGGRCTLLRDSKVGGITKTIHIVIVATPGSVIPVAVSVKLNPAIQSIDSIGSITVEHPKNTIPARSFPIYYLLATRSLNGSTRSVGHFQRGGIMHIVAMNLDDEDSANTHTAVDYDMRWFREKVSPITFKFMMCLIFYKVYISTQLSVSQVAELGCLVLNLDANRFPDRCEEANSLPNPTIYNNQMDIALSTVR
ncbi:hypothetical protein BJ138DRAFT_1108053, partial [Hygrophoropsis aurantiaca]